MSGRLGTFGPNPSPENVRGCLFAYYQMLDACKAMRAEMEANGEPLADRLCAAGIQQEIEEAIVAANRVLSRIARRGGRGQPPGAGRSPAVKGHGCPALAPAVGPAPTLRPEAADSVQRNRADITTPASPLFCGQQVQKLPGALPPATVTQQREEA